MLTRRIVWRKPYAAARLPLLARLHRAAYSASPRLRHELLKIPLRRLFAQAYRLGLGGRGAFTLMVKAQSRLLSFDARNLQYASLYMPQHVPGYEPETSALLDALVGPEAVFYDIGSNWGYFSLFLAARAGFRGKVHAFEPSAESFGDLLDLVRQTGLAPQITCHNVGLSDRTGAAALAAPDDVHGGCATVTETGSGAPISLKRLDDLGLEPPEVIKMDVEDHELQVLEGGRGTLARAKPHIVFESSIDRRPDTKMAPFELLASMGYVFFHPAWREGTGRGRCVRHVALREGLPVVQALVPFEPCQRLLFEDMLNVFACHRDRLAQLESVFERD